MKINIKNIKVGSICATLFISLFLSCNNGIEELEKQRDSILSISNLRQGFLDVFALFGDMVSDAFGIKADTTKEDIGRYFTNIADTMKSVKEKLNSIVAESGNYEKVKEKVNVFIKTIEKIEEGAKIAAGGAKGDAKIGGATVTGQEPTPADETSVNALVKGIKTIVGVLLESKGDPNATKTDGEKNKVVGKLFEKKASGTEEAAAAASASIGAITGADILKAIASSEKATENKDIDQASTAAEIAIAKANASGKQDIKEDARKDAVIAAGIALRAMAKSGKFAANNDAKHSNAVNGAAASAVNKTLSTLIIAIRNTVDSGLKIINKVLAEVKQEDQSSEVTASGTDTK